MRHSYILSKKYKDLRDLILADNFIITMEEKEGDLSPMLLGSDFAHLGKIYRVVYQSNDLIVYIFNGQEIFKVPASIPQKEFINLCKKHNITWVLDDR